MFFNDSARFIFLIKKTVDLLYILSLSGTSFLYAFINWHPYMILKHCPISSRCDLCFIFQ